VKKKRVLMLLLQLGLVVGFSASFYSYVQKEVEPTQVYTYSQDLNLKDSVKVSVEEIPAKAVKEGMVIVGSEEYDQETLEKQVVNTKVSKGHYVYSNQLTEEENIDPFETMDLSKHRKISLPISYVEGFGGDIKRGDKIDLIFTGQGEKASENGDATFQYSKTFLQDVIVYNITTGSGFKFQDHSKNSPSDLMGEEGETIATENASDELAVITIAVTLDQAEEISARKSIGTISFASRFEDEQSYETRGFVVGEYDKIFSAPANAEKNTNNN